MQSHFGNEIYLISRKEKKNNSDNDLDFEEMIFRRALAAGSRRKYIGQTCNKVKLFRHHRRSLVNVSRAVDRWRHLVGNKF